METSLKEWSANTSVGCKINNIEDNCGNIGGEIATKGENAIEGTMKDNSALI